MSYHASGRPAFRTGSVVVVPADVRVTPRYGHDVSASGWASSDRNGMSARVASEVLRGSKRGRKAGTRVIRPDGQEGAHARAARIARERAAAGTVRMGEVD